jgi:hypothetical protein
MQYKHFYVHNTHITVVKNDRHVIFPLDMYQAPSSEYTNSDDYRSSAAGGSVKGRPRA